MCREPREGRLEISSFLCRRSAGEIIHSTPSGVVCQCMLTQGGLRSDPAYKRVRVNRLDQYLSYRMDQLGGEKGMLFACLGLV